VSSERALAPAKATTLPSSLPLTAVGTYASALVIALVFAVPLVWTLSTSLKDASTVTRFPPTLLPDEPHWENYVEIFRRHPFATWIWNTTQITLTATLGTVVSATLVAYSFARFRYPGRDLFFFLTVSTMILPTEVTVVPTYLLFRALGWLDSYKPIVVPFWLGGSAFFVFLLRQFMLTLPRDMDDAARIDGANSLQTLVYVLAPLMKPALTAVTVISFIQHWDEFFLPLIYINTTAYFPLSLGLRYFQNSLLGEGLPQYHLMMAGATVATIPPIGLFVAAQRYFVQGVVMSGLKG
jgi:ABC-type glycerol-3-phosphate transport system permease component